MHSQPGKPCRRPQSRLAGSTRWARNLQTPLRSFLSTETGSSAFLLAATLLALAWVNIDASSYDAVWRTSVSVHVGHAEVANDLRGWVNNGLMTLFFFTVGLEARREFDVGELRARIRALLRRSGMNGDASGLTYQELRLDGARHGVSVDESFVELTRTEYQLLELLMLNAGRVLPHNLIYERVWGYDFGPASNALRVYIGYLRRKLERAGARPLLHTVRGVGYVLREP